mmetsp:Transcript_12350/g.29335  ORF Transcript_12350/g.29335 Transcript_12350/m.29335 type:complete len:903 (+) Transcript_12350:82-2790(+)
MNQFTFVFLLDTSPSMNQRTSGGLTLLDCAKSAVEHFMKVRQRDPSSKTDTYLLVTCEEGKEAIKAIDRPPNRAFMAALKGVTAKDLGVLGSAVKTALSFVNLQRLSRGSDTYGHGYSTAALDPAMLILLTDGTEDALHLPPGPSLGSELANQPFRWDQRLFSVFMRMPAVPGAGSSGNGSAAGPSDVPGAESAVSAMCEVTGGRGMAVASLKALLHAMESLVARAQPTALISFEPMARGPSPSPQPDLNAASGACKHRAMSVRAGGFWPLPEGFRVGGAQRLPPREAHPSVAYIPVAADPAMPKGLPVDIYEVEACPINGQMMSAEGGRRPESFCWQVCSPSLPQSSGGTPEPFGFLQLKRQGAVMCLHVLPYNYPVLAALLEQTNEWPPPLRTSPPATWRSHLERYCAAIPFYYLVPLRAAFKRMGLSPQLVPEPREGLTPAAAAHLKHLQKQAKAELDALKSAMRQPVAEPKGGCPEPIFSDAFRIPRASLLQQMSLLTARLVSAYGSAFRTAKAGGSVMAELDTRRREAARFEVPISIMGDYQETALAKAPPRDPFTDDEERNRQQRLAFGNPYKTDKRSSGAVLNMMEVDGLVDEAGEAMKGPALAPGKGASRTGRRRQQVASAPPPPPTSSQDPDTAEASWARKAGELLAASKGSAGAPSSSTSSSLTTESSAGDDAGDEQDSDRSAPLPTPPAAASTAMEATASQGQELAAAPGDPPAEGQPPGHHGGRGDGDAGTGARVDPAEFDAMWAASFSDQGLEQSSTVAKRKARPDELKGPRPPKRRVVPASRSSGKSVPHSSASAAAPPAGFFGHEVASGRPVAPDLRGTQHHALRLLRIFHSHREGFVDMSKLVLSALQSFEGNRKQWARDLIDAAHNTNKHSIARCLREAILQGQV